MSLFFIVISYTASAQLSFSVNGRAINYRGNFKRNVYGLGLKLNYQLSLNQHLSFSYNQGFPLKLSGEINAYNDNKDTTVAAISTYKFKNFQIAIGGIIFGDKYTAATLYYSLGIEYVKLVYEKKPVSAYDHNRYPSLYGDSRGTDNGIFATGCLGFEYRIGLPALFTEALLAYPATARGDNFSATDLPMHFQFNAGIKIYFKSVPKN